MTPIACVLCSIDPNMPSLVVPFAQATVIAAPILLRDHVKRGARAIADRLGPGDRDETSPDLVVDDDPEAPSD